MILNAESKEIDYDSRDENFKNKYREHVEREQKLREKQEKDIQLMCSVMKILIILLMILVVYQRVMM